jgi:hypothetical protein
VFEGKSKTVARPFQENPSWVIYPKFDAKSHKILMKDSSVDGARPSGVHADLKLAGPQLGCGQAAKLEVIGFNFAGARRNQTFLISPKSRFLRAPRKTANTRVGRKIHKLRGEEKVDFSAWIILRRPGGLLSGLGNPTLECL